MSMAFRNALSRTVLLLALSVFAWLAAHAGGIEVVQFEDPVQERRYMELIRELRCLVCQNQTLAESNADLARDMRAVVKRMVQEEAGNEEIVSFMVERYGNFVLYRPPVTAQTMVLWFAPFTLVLVLLALAPALIRRRKRVKLSDQERLDAKRLLQE